MLEYASNAAYTVTTDRDLHKRGVKSRNRDRVWTELTELSLVRTDLTTGKASVALEIAVKDVDFPTKDARVTALSVNPEWSAPRDDS
ncbi:hypothetical protein J2S40_004368 [Nocardioides luteus]|uniref:PIN domain-containing protein n=1 Tax=Nocardioides luteus TaxID=1844 RepID=A0ABQ5SRT9_9ACTN|nr:hypothetical protein [Nocardioides luteus]MDR7313310.1 hypothetical protein [Nocardioides luteus]GGR60156.1 hypothetical protein GCM10010197_28730 [Nocardioides luteus]GLJ66375.1 hypothetical protein GCM10017579_04110 [Nocardioides luteus]